MPNLIIRIVVRSLHNIFTSIWVGGILTMVISVLPSIRREIKEPATQGLLIDRIMFQHSKWIYAGILMLALTGMVMTRLSGRSSGLLYFSNPYAVVLSIKHILMLLISAIAVVRSIAFKHVASGKHKSKKKLGLLFIYTFLGVVILVLSSMSAVIK
jgi:putative copper export protein